jgi:hypothetical protein
MMNTHMSRRVGRRALAVGSLAAAIAAGAAAVLSALGAPTAGPVASASAAAPTSLGSRSVAFGHGRVVFRMRTSSLGCFRVVRGSSTVARSCVSELAPDQIEYASSRYAVGGVAGADVRAVIVRLTNKGTVWAQLRRGMFYTDVPARHNVRAVVKVLRDGSRTSFTVTGSR